MQGRTNIYSYNNSLALTRNARIQSTLMARGQIWQSTLVAPFLQPFLYALIAARFIARFFTCQSAVVGSYQFVVAVVRAAMRGDLLAFVADWPERFLVSRARRNGDRAPGPRSHN